MIWYFVIGLNAIALALAIDASGDYPIPEKSFFLFLFEECSYNMVLFSTLVFLSVVAWPGILAYTTWCKYEDQKH